jgi:hypothetical protein
MTDHFDKFIKDKLNDYSSPVPDGLWEKIQQGKDERRFAAWWKNYWLVGVIGFTALCGGALLWQKNNSNINITTPSSSTIAKDETVKGNNFGKATQPRELVDDNKTSINQTSDANLSITKNINPSNNNINDVSTSDNNTNNFSTNNSSKKDFFTRDKFVQSRVSFTHKSSSHITSANNKTNTAISKNIDSYNSEFRHTLFATAQQDKNIFYHPLNEQLLNDLKGIHLFGGDDCPSARGAIKNDIYLEVYASPDYAKKTTNNSNGNDAFLKRKDSTESMRLSYTAGFRLSKTIGENLLLKAGLQYSQINEKFTYRTENERRLTTVITIRTVVRSPGDTVMVRDTSTIEQIGYRVKTTYNRYRSIDVPLILAYEWGNDNFRAAVSGGVILNLYSWAKGESLDTSYVPVPFDKNSAQTFKQNIGMGVYASLSLIKRISDKAELFAEPYARYNISNMTSNKSLYTQRFEVAGLNLGIRYKINRSGQRYYSR